MCIAHRLLPIWQPAAGNAHHSSIRRKIDALFQTPVAFGVVRFNGTQRNTTLLIDLRIDVDYREPHGGDGPVRITYNWEENGVARHDVHVTSEAEETYKIHCEGKPLMGSIVLERP